MASILEDELSQTIGDALLDADIPLDVLLVRKVVVGPGPNPWDPPVTQTFQYPCKGFADTLSETFRASTLIWAGDVKVVIVAKTLATEPEPGDTVTVRGQTYSVVNVSTDPALALYELQARA